jgi:phosphopantetheine adenylyltransferase
MHTYTARVLIKRGCVMHDAREEVALILVRSVRKGEDFNVLKEVA